MCGITGFLAFSHQSSTDEIHATITAMTDTLIHRGPDDRGVWSEPETGVALGHRRLSILDLSPEGHQPMLSSCGRYVLVFNGEIYNFTDLRQQLQSLGHKFRGTSDTEVMLAAFREWGVEAAVQQFNGMFAFALWDRPQRVLHLGRDRFGEKPLYYGWLGQTFLFGSELKALRSYPGFPAEIHRDALALYLRHNYIPAPYSIYKNIKKLPPGTLLSVKSGSSPTEPKSYWSARAVAEWGISNPFQGSEADAIAELDTILKDAVGLRMIADVPLGAFLSGGVDSSTVVALMQAQSRVPVKTFTIGFYEDNYNEAKYANAIAKHLGTDHTEFYVTPTEALEVIPKLPSLYDEPFADSSQIPTFLVSQLTRKYVTVSLSGDAGDELFHGYNRYFTGEDIWQKMGWMPSILRHLSSSGIRSLSPQSWNQILTPFSSILPGSLRYRNLGDRLHKLAEILPAPNRQSFYRRLVSHWKNPEDLLVRGVDSSFIWNERASGLGLFEFAEQMMYLDTVTYLPDDILVKVDRATMGVSLEARVPLLDPRIFEFAWRVPLSMKVQNNQGKWLLRQVLYKYVPKELVDRPKKGFAVPIDKWLRTSLRDWAEALLDEDRLKQDGFFYPQPIRQKWSEHLSGDRNWQYDLWDVLMFQAWLDENHISI